MDVRGIKIARMAGSMDLDMPPRPLSHWERVRGFSPGATGARPDRKERHFRRMYVMKRTVTLTSVSVMLLAVCLWTLDAWARAGGGKSTGSRGARSW